MECFEEECTFNVFDVFLQLPQPIRLPAIFE